VCIAGGDNYVHVLDPRENKELWCGKDASSSSRPFRAIFAGDYVISVGFTKYLSDNLH